SRGGSQTPASGLGTNTVTSKARVGIRLLSVTAGPVADHTGNMGSPPSSGGDVANRPAPTSMSQTVAIASRGERGPVKEGIPHALCVAARSRARGLAAKHRGACGRECTDLADQDAPTRR